MKKILIVEVPHDPDIDGEYIKILSLEITVLFDNMPVRYSGALKFTELTPPSDEEIQAEADKHYDNEFMNDTYFLRGANWFKSLLQ